MRDRARTVLSILIVPLIVAAAIIGPAWVMRKEAESTRKVVCTTYIANRSELAALRSISRELGLPARFPVPEVPPECAEFLSPSP